MGTRPCGCRSACTLDGQHWGLQPDLARRHHTFLQHRGFPSTAATAGPPAQLPMPPFPHLQQAPEPVPGPQARDTSAACRWPWDSATCSRWPCAGPPTGLHKRSPCTCGGTSNRSPRSGCQQSAAATAAGIWAAAARRCARGSTSGGGYQDAPRHGWARCDSPDPRHHQLALEAVTTPQGHTEGEVHGACLRAVAGGADAEGGESFN